MQTESVMQTANERNKIEGKIKSKTETTSAGDVQKHKTKEGGVFNFILAQFYNVCRNYNLDWNNKNVFQSLPLTYIILYIVITGRRHCGVWREGE